MARCRFRKRDGTACMGAATGSNGGCWAHDDDYRLQRKRIARKGGQSGGRGRASSPGTEDLARLQRAFEDLAERVLAGTIDRSDAAVATQAWNGARACIVASARLRELEEVEKRLGALEQSQDNRRA